MNSDVGMHHEKNSGHACSHNAYTYRSMATVVYLSVWDYGVNYCDHVHSYACNHSAYRPLGFSHNYT